MQDNALKTIAVLGGTGKEGSGLALRWADKAHEAARAMNDTLGTDRVSGAANPEAAAASDIVVLAVPFAAQQSTAADAGEGLKGKILIDVTVPLVPPKVGRVQLPNGGSAVEALQLKLGPEVRVVSAFQNISSHHLTKLDDEVDCDVLVCADDPADAETVVELAREIGLRAWNAGPLANSVVSEGLTSVLITLNRRYKVPGSGIRITGVGAQSA